MYKTKAVLDNFNTMNELEKKIAILIGGRFIDKSKVSKSLLDMENIRKKLTMKAKDFNGVEEIRKWREARCK